MDDYYLPPLLGNPNLLAQGERAMSRPRKQLEGYEAAQLAGMIPGAGLVGLLGDLQQYAEKPETRGILNYGLTALGAVPFLGAMAKMAGQMPRGILQKQAGAIAYHGSPYQFDKFDMGKVGTGTGGNTWGRGAYLSGSKEEAGQYARTLGIGFKMGDPKVYKVDVPDSEIAKMIDLDAPLSIQPRVAEFLRGVLPQKTAATRIVEQAIPGTGRTGYSVILNDTQGQQIFRSKEAAQQFADRQTRSFDLGASVSDLLQSIPGGIDGMTKAVKDAGFKGIKYTPQPGRPTNFVVFDEELLRIVGRE